MQRNLFTLILAVAFTIAFATAIWADVQAPSVNQQIGIPDTVFDNLQEADCRLCHDKPDQSPVDNETLPDRLHLLYGQPIPEGSVVPNPDADNDGIVTPWEVRAHRRNH